MKKLVVVLIHIAFWYAVGSIYASSWEISGIAHGGGRSMWDTGFFSDRAFPLMPTGLNFYFIYFFVVPFFIEKKLYLKPIVLAVISSIVSGIFMIAIFNFLEGGNDFEFSRILYATQLMFIFGFCGAIMKIFFQWFSDLKYKQKLEKKNLQTELALLKSQISPHFLFNTLNNIDVLISKDSEKASSYMKKLSDILRFMLYETKEESIPMSLELEYIEKYIELQKIRTSNNSFVNIAINGKTEGLNIAPMIFIPFIENAFKHTTNKKTDNAITIRFDFSDDTIKFNCENFKSKNEALIQKPSGLGINLIEQRLNLLYKNKNTLKIEDSGDKYFVSLTIRLNEN